MNIPNRKTTGRRMGIFILLIALAGVLLYGVIEVRRVQEPIAGVVAGELRVPLLKKALVERFESGEDPHAIYKNLKTSFASYYLNVQHPAAHVFGEVLFDYAGTDGIGLCDTDFAFGCFHSLFGRAIAVHGVDVIPRLEQGCVEAHGIMALGCVHGIGHGLGEYFGPQNIREQLSHCKSLSWQGTLFGCSDGVFMEYHFPADVTAEKATTRVMPLIAGDEYNPCPIIGNIYTSSCYFSLPSWWIDVLQKDEKKMEELCSGAPGQTVQRFCFLGIGYAFAPALQYDVAAVEQRCDAMEKIQEQTLCRAGASFAFFANENERIKAPALCDFPGQRGKDCINAADLLALQGA